MIALQLTYNNANLHDCGTVSIVSQRTEYSPNDYPQKQTRDLHVRIDKFANDAGYNYDLLYNNLQTVRDALKTQNGILKWISPGASAGETQLERPVLVVSHDLPEDPNAIGVYRQSINIVFRYELDATAECGALTATVSGTGTVPATISLGQVHAFKDDFANQFYSEWKGHRRRSSGVLTASGELFRGAGETGSATDNRMAEVLSALTALRTQLEGGRYVTLKYGTDGAIFNREVKIEAFSADIAQGPKVGIIKWALTASYTRFPDEDAFAAAEVTSSVNRDQTTGLETFTLTGKVLAATEVLAVAKLATVVATMTAAYGFAATNQTRRETSKNWVNADDTQDEDTTHDGAAVADTLWLELNFSYAYEKKAANIVSYTLTISDADDLHSGLITRTYAGTVVASSSTEAAAYSAALAQARTLGDKKHAFRVSSQESRADRKLASQASAEFVRVDFQYVYQTKGSRIYLEMSTSTVTETFGETQERVSGFVVAVDVETAQEQYTALVKQPYTSANRLIRNETLDQSQQIVETGPAWYGSAGTSTMPIRLDFSLTVFTAKTTGTFAIKYGVKVASDYVALSLNTTVDGVFAADATQMAALEAGTSNQLTDFLTDISANFGEEVSREITYDKEKVGSAAATPVLVRFTSQYAKALSMTAQVLKCSLTEDMTYSGTRWVSQQNPDGPDTIQNCGKTQATRTVGGDVTAATEQACMDWVTKQHGATGLWEQWRDTKPSGDRYEEPITISTGFEYPPLVDGMAGSARGGDVTGTNFQVATIRFAFKELIPLLAAPF